MAKERLLLLGNPDICGRYVGFARKKAKKARLARLEKGVSVLQKRFSLEEVDIFIKVSVTSTSIQIEGGGWQFWVSIEDWKEYPDLGITNKMFVWNFRLPSKFTQAMVDDVGYTFSSKRIVDGSTISYFINASDIPDGWVGSNTNQVIPYKKDRVALTRANRFDHAMGSLPTYYETSFELYSGGFPFYSSSPYCITDETDTGPCVQDWLIRHSPLTIQSDKDRLSIVDSRYAFLPITNAGNSTVWDGSKFNCAFLAFVPKSTFTEEFYVEQLKIHTHLLLATDASELTTSVLLRKDGWLCYSTFKKTSDNPTYNFEVKLIRAYFPDIVGVLNGEKLLDDVQMEFIDFFSSSAAGADPYYYTNCFLFSTNSNIQGYILDEDGTGDYYVFLSNYEGQDPVDAAGEIYDYAVTITRAGIQGAISFYYAKAMSFYAISSTVLYVTFQLYDTVGIYNPGNSGVAIVKMQRNVDTGEWDLSIPYAVQTNLSPNPAQAAIQIQARPQGKYIFLVHYNTYSKTYNYQKCDVYDLETEVLFPFSERFSESTSLAPQNVFGQFDSIYSFKLFGEYYA